MVEQWIETPVGYMVGRWNEQGLLYACSFAKDQEELSKERSSTLSALTSRQLLLQETLVNYFVHGALEWDLRWLDWTGVSDFHRKVLELCYDVPAGKTVSYGELAARAGNPNAARAVGGAMAKNRWPIIIPCHRVVGATGKLTGYSGHGGLDTKKHLIALEC